MPKGKKPGSDNNKPGQYISVGPRGGQLDNPRVVTVGAGDRLPPTAEPGQTWIPKPGRPRSKK